MPAAMISEVEDSEGRKWALKRINGDSQSVLEAERLAKLRNHPLVVPLQSIFVDGGVTFLQMPFYRNGDLRAWVEKIKVYNALVCSLATELQNVQDCTFHNPDIDCLATTLQYLYCYSGSTSNSCTHTNIHLCCYQATSMQPFALCTDESPAEAAHICKSAITYMVLNLACIWVIVLVAGYQAEHWFPELVRKSCSALHHAPAGSSHSIHSPAGHHPP